MRLIIILLLLMCLPAYAAPIQGRATVIDDDTIAVERTMPRIRLDAIDAPESSQPCFDYAGARYLWGSRAAESLADIIGRNGRVTCTEKERDRYSRIVAVCLAGATDIGRDGPPRLGNRIQATFGWLIRRRRSRRESREGWALVRKV